MVVFFTKCHQEWLSCKKIGLCFVLYHSKGIGRWRSDHRFYFSFCISRAPNGVLDLVRFSNVLLQLKD